MENRICPYRLYPKPIEQKPTLFTLSVDTDTEFIVGSMAPRCKLLMGIIETESELCIFPEKPGYFCPLISLHFGNISFLEFTKRMKERGENTPFTEESYREKV